MNKGRKSSADLFQAAHEANLKRRAAAGRPHAAAQLDEFVGQEHFLGPGKLLRRLLQADRLSSVIFHGPPGCGKTALAHVIAQQTQCVFRRLNAVAAGIKEVREILEEARAELAETGRRTILFVDELHRFNRAQQDVLLPDVEEGRVILIGATTQNPFFAINSPLLSRSQIFSFEPLDAASRFGYSCSGRWPTRNADWAGSQSTMREDALAFLAEICDGDARRALTRWRSAFSRRSRSRSTSRSSVAQESIQRKVLDYDPTGDAHYDVASAFIKSMRGSDPDAAIYWLARHAGGGRRSALHRPANRHLASEDVGNADPQALVVAAAAVQAVEFVGLPECQLPLAQAVTYLATAPKSNASTLAIGKAREDVRSGRTLPVPKHLRDSALSRRAKQLGHGRAINTATITPRAGLSKHTCRRSDAITSRSIAGTKR